MEPPLVASVCDAALPTTELAGWLVGRIVGVTPRGRLLVDYPGNAGGPVEAGFLAGVATELDGETCEGLPVLLVFQNEAGRRPIIVGVVRDTLRPPERPAEVSPDPAQTREVTVGGKKLIFTAHEEIVLRCGKSSVTLRQDGKILIQGEHVVSRANGTNRIKGGAVAIN